MKHVEMWPILLTEAQEGAIVTWAADDRLWTTQETVEHNLRVFARMILKHELEEARDLRREAEDRARQDDRADVPGGGQAGR
jgi:hypothetical protein